MHIQHPEHSTRLLETSLSVSPATGQRTAAQTSFVSGSTPEQCKLGGPSHLSERLNLGVPFACKDNISNIDCAARAQQADDMKPLGHSTGTDQSYMDRLVCKVSRMTCVGEDCQSEIEFDPRTSRNARYERSDSSFEDGQKQWYNSQTVSPVTVSSGYDSDQEYMPTREDEIDALLYGKSPVSFKRAKNRSKGHPGTQCNRPTSKSGDDYVIRADDLYHENYASSSDADSPAHKPRRRNNTNGIYTKNSADGVRCSYRNQHSALRHGESPRVTSRLNFRESKAESPNVSKLTDVKRSMKEIIQDLASETSKGQLKCMSSLAPEDSGVGPEDNTSGSLRYERPPFLGKEPKSKGPKESLLSPPPGSIPADRCQQMPPTNLDKDTLNPFLTLEGPYLRQKLQAPAGETLPLSEESGSYGFSIASESSGLGNLSDNGGHPGQVSGFYSSTLGEGSISSDSGRASFGTSDYVDYDYELWTAPNEGTNLTEHNEEEPIYETIPDELVTSSSQGPSPQWSRLNRSPGDVRRWSMADSEHTYATIEPGSRHSLVEPPALPARNYNRKLDLPYLNSSRRSRAGSRGNIGQASRKLRKPLHLDDMVKANDIVDMDGCHIYTVNDVLESFERLAGHLPKARDNIYTLVDDKETRRNLSQSLQMEDQLINEGLLPRPGAASSQESLYEEDPKYLTPRPCRQDCCSSPTFNQACWNTSHTSRTQWNNSIAELQGTYC